MSEEAIKQHAEEFARKHRKAIAAELTDPSIYVPDEIPISIFMAGSPGAGKTEYSVRLLRRTKMLNLYRNVIRIDGDELRKRIPGYVGSNSYLFNTAVSLIVERIHDLALHNGQTFLLDGTFSHYEKARDNINRSLKRGRDVLIFYVYQRPDVAWKFTQAREVLEGRNIPKDAFIEKFISSRETVRRIHQEFGNAISISIVKKNFETHEIENIIDVGDAGDSIDDYIGTRYTIDDLRKML